MSRKKIAAWKRGGFREGTKGGIYIGDTKGLSSPKNSRRGCLCKDNTTYSRKCCEGYLINQGIGQTEREALERGAFSAGFSTGFDTKDIYDY
jgi:hypothetical protein